MATATRNTDHNLGFMDGFAAGNISANENELKVHSDKIKDFLEKAKDTFDVVDIENMIKEKLKEEVTKFIRTSYPNSTTEDFYSFTTDLSDLMTSLHTAIPIEKLPTETNFLIKRAIFNFLTIAKTLSDKRIVDIALNIAALYK